MIKRIFLIFLLPGFLFSATRVYITSTTEVVEMDPSTNTVTTTFTPSFGGKTAIALTGVAILYNQKTAYIPDVGNKGVWVINTADNTTENFIPLPSGADTPVNIVVTRDQTKVYVSDLGKNQFYSIDLSDNSSTTIPSSFPSGNPYGFALNVAGTKLYVTAANSTEDTLPVEVYTTSNDTILTTIPSFPAQDVTININDIGYVPSLAAGGNVGVFDATTDTDLSTIQIGSDRICGPIATDATGHILYVSTEKDDVTDPYIQIITDNVPGDTIPLSDAASLLRVNPDDQNQIYGLWANPFATTILIIENETVESPPSFTFASPYGIGFIGEPRPDPISNISGETLYNRFPFQTDVIYSLTWDYDPASSPVVLDSFVIYRDGVEIGRNPAPYYQDHNQVAMESHLYEIQPFYRDGTYGAFKTFTYP